MSPAKVVFQLTDCRRHVEGIKTCDMILQRPSSNLSAQVHFRVQFRSLSRRIPCLAIFVLSGAPLLSEIAYFEKLACIR